MATDTSTDRINGISQVPGIPNADGTPYAPPPTEPNRPISNPGSGGSSWQGQDGGWYTMGPNGPTSTEPPPTSPQSADQVQQQMVGAAQGEINAINQAASGLLADQKIINEKNDRSTSSISTLTGLAGSTEANVEQRKTTAEGQRANKRIQDEASGKIQSLLGEIRRSSITEARSQREEARLAESDRIANRAARQKEATDQLTNLASSGVTFEGLKKADPNGFAYLAKQFGGESALKGAFVLNTPQDQIIDKKLEGGKYIIAKQNPITGKVSVETLDLGLPVGYDKTIDAGDRILAIPNNWSGDTSELITINKGLTPAQRDSGDGGGIPGENPQLYSGLSSKTATAVRAKTSAFKSEPIVTNFSTIQEGRNFANGLKNDTQNPADDQGLIYALAKALDPGSVVREGEYATAQKYSQSWVAAYGKGVTQALLGTGFLSTTARENIKKTIETKYAASKKSYDNVYGQYKKGINSLTGRADGDKFLTDYSIQDGGSDGGSDDPQVAELKSLGYTDEQIKQLQGN